MHQTQLAPVCFLAYVKRKHQRPTFQHVHVCVFMAHCCRQSFGACFTGVVVIACATVTVLVFFTWPICFCQPAAATVKAMLVVPNLEFFKCAPSRPKGSLMRDAGADTRVASLGHVKKQPHARRPGRACDAVDGIVAGRVIASPGPFRPNKCFGSNYTCLKAAMREVCCIAHVKLN